MSTRQTSTAGLTHAIDWRGVIRRWPGVALAAGIAFLLATLYLAISKPAYDAETRVLIQNVGLGLEAGGGGSTYDKEFLSTQAEVIRSPATISRSLEELPPVTEESDPIGAITENLRVNTLAGTDIVRVTFQHHDPEHAVQRLESIIESYRSHLRSVEKTSTSHSMQLLTQRSAELEQQITHLQQQLRIARSTWDVTVVVDEGREDGGPVLKELLARWATIQSQLASVDASLVAESGPALATSIAEFNPDWSHELSQLQRELTLAQVQADELSQIYGRAHTERIAAERRLESLKIQYAVRETEVRSSLSGQKARIEREAESLSTLLAAEQDRLASLADIRLDEQQLHADLARVSELHASTVQTLEALRLADRTIADGRGSIRVEVLDDFVVPQTPIWPKPIPLLATSTVLGFLLGLAIVVLIQTTSRSTSLLAESTGVAVPEAAILEDVKSLQGEVRAAHANLQRGALVAGEPV